MQMGGFSLRSAIASLSDLTHMHTLINHPCFITVRFSSEGARDDVLLVIVDLAAQFRSKLE